MKLLIERIEEVQYLTEEINGKKHTFLEGTFIQGGIGNRNKRLYPMHILEREVGRYNSEYINSHRAFSELGHPDTPQIHLERICGLITELRQDGNNYIGKMKILDTPNGKIVQALVEGGGQLGVSTRGTGSLKPRDDGLNEVMDDFHIATAADVVADPSAPDAFVNAVMESAEWLFENGVWKAKFAEVAKKTINNTPKRNIQENKVKLFESFLRQLAK